METIRGDKLEAFPTPVDKLRLALVYFLSVPDNAISKEDYAELEKELRAAGADVAALDYVRRTREITRMTVASTVGGTATPNVVERGELFKGFSALGNRVCDCHLAELSHVCTSKLTRPYALRSSRTASRRAGSIP